MNEPESDRATLILLAADRSKQSFLNGFWSWVRMLESREYTRAVQALHWRGEPMSPDVLESQTTTVFGFATEPMTAVVPNERLIQVINDSAEVEWDEGGGWAMAQIPLTNEPDRRKEDDVYIFGLATSFFIRKVGEQFVLEFEIFHA